MSSPAVKYATILIGGSAVIAAFLYPIAIKPYFESEKWSKCNFFCKKIKINVSYSILNTFSEFILTKHFLITIFSQTCRKI